MKPRRIFINQSNWVKNYRKSTKFSQGTIADAFGLSHQNVSNWERGEAGVPENLLLDIACLGKPSEAQACANLNQLIEAKLADYRQTLLLQVMEAAKVIVAGEIGSDELLLAIRNGLHSEQYWADMMAHCNEVINGKSAEETTTQEKV